MRSLLRRIAISLCAVILLTISVYAEPADSIRFRDIEWYSTEEVVLNEIMAIPNVEKKSFGWQFEKDMISGWDIGGSIGDYASCDNLLVSKGGVIEMFENIMVAGYAAQLELQYLYPIRDGRVDYLLENAQLFKATYTITSVKYLDGVYEDLNEKLTGLYGVSEEKNRGGRGITGCVWHAEDGSLVYLAKKENVITHETAYVSILYFAPGAEERLNELGVLIKAEEQDEAKIEFDSIREDIKDDTDGL